MSYLEKGRRVVLIASIACRIQYFGFQNERRFPVQMACHKTRGTVVVAAADVIRHLQGCTGHSRPFDDKAHKDGSAKVLIDFCFLFMWDCPGKVSDVTTCGFAWSVTIVGEDDEAVFKASSERLQVLFGAFSAEDDDAARLPQTIQLLSVEKTMKKKTTKNKRKQRDRSVMKCR